MTPETLAFIRMNAERMSIQSIADELGWPIERLRRTARDRQITLVGYVPVATSQVVSQPEPKPTKPAKSHHRTGYQRGGEIDVRPGMSLHEIAGLLPRRQGQILRILATLSESTTSFTNAAAIAAAIGDGLHVRSIGLFIQLIDKRLKRTKWTIESLLGPNGGYRLVERQR